MNQQNAQSERAEAFYSCVRVSVVMLCSTFDRVLLVCVERKNICPIHFDRYVVPLAENHFRS